MWLEAVTFATDIQTDRQTEVKSVLFVYKQNNDLTNSSTFDFVSYTHLLAEALVNGYTLKIEGGNFKVCDGGEEHCKCAGGPKRHCKQISIQRKEDDKMRIAIPLDENKKDVCVVFARAPYFLFQDEDTETVMENPAAEAPVSYTHLKNSCRECSSLPPALRCWR